MTMTNARSTERGALPGVFVAAVTALISGVSVFVNSYGVHAVRQPTVYTTAKNLVATIILATLALTATGLRRSVGWHAGEHWVTPPRHRAVDGKGAWRQWTPWRGLALAYVGVVGGGAAFILFFDGLARTTATPAAFLHDSLVIWVALLAMPLLRERLNSWNLAAIVLLVGGQIAVLGGVGQLAMNTGDLLVLAATLLWAVEVVVAKQLLSDLSPGAVSLVRMGVGSAVLVIYLAVHGSLGALFSFTAGQLGWVVLTGALLAGYVGTWMTALCRARAVDVTSVLVASTLVTALLTTVAGTAPVPPEVLGLALIAVGVGLVVWFSRRRAVA
jgi:drug/metabolite transporter (DMT)-like permease